MATTRQCLDVPHGRDRSSVSDIDPSLAQRSVPHLPRTHPGPLYFLRLHPPSPPPRDWVRGCRISSRHAPVTSAFVCVWRFRNFLGRSSYREEARRCRCRWQCQCCCEHVGRSGEGSVAKDQNGTPQPIEHFVCLCPKASGRPPCSHIALALPHHGHGILGSPCTVCIGFSRGGSVVAVGWGAYKTKRCKSFPNFFRACVGACTGGSPCVPYAI